MPVEVNNLTDYKINKALVKKIVKDILPGKKISLAIVDKKTIKQINQKYRNKNQATDVLSFGSISEPFYVPEIVICPEKAENVYQSLIHGILHVLGHNHQNMKEKEKYYSKKYA